ncbi:DNA adenine methylase [Acinetobacter sp. MB5]|uniref:DNA adenine methylase n=1 Tax=Acinetobacter sp. MB5 TaxID=2069438 RepID=UPI000DCF96C6|nr:DNA adenine methylase [Acinetobacter sp. MB5]
MKYPGGKGKCYQHIINLMPVHDTYIESHLGGGSVMRNKKPAQRNIGIDVDSKVIGMWEENFPNICELILGDALSFLKNYSFDGNELIYVDPPYYPDTRRNTKIYTHEYTHDDHGKLLSLLKILPCKIIISGYDHPFYNEQLQGWKKISFQAKTHADTREETVWFNFDEPKILHDSRYYGKNFRERQTLKRRQERLYKKIREMNSIERNELLRWINTEYSEELGEISCN